MDELDKLTRKPETTIVEARKLLGRKYTYMSDNQVQDLIVSLTLIARKSLKI
jgi:hypothetical protein